MQAAAPEDDQRASLLLRHCRDEALLWLAHAHVAAGDGGSAANCLGLLQQLGSPAAGHPAAGCLAVSAALLQGRLQVCYGCLQVCIAFSCSIAIGFCRRFCKSSPAGYVIGALHRSPQLPTACAPVQDAEHARSTS